MKSDRITCRFIQYTMDIMYQNIIQDISIACMQGRIQDFCNGVSISKKL